MRRLTIWLAVSVSFVLALAGMTGSPASAQSESVRAESATVAPLAMRFCCYFWSQSACIAEGNELVRLGYASSYDCRRHDIAPWGLWYNP